MDDDGAYKMGTIVRLTGLSPAVLRAWESRYGIVVPRRAPKGHRVYSEEDLAVLRGIQRLLAEGRSIGELALLGRQALMAQAAFVPSGPRRFDGSALDAARDEIVRGAVELDDSRIARALDEIFAVVTPEVAIDSVVVPAAHEIGELWASGRVTVAGERLASAHFAMRLQKLLDAARPPAGAPVALCAGLPDDWHQLGPLAVAHRLAGIGWRALYLGPALPLEDLDRACDGLAPALVCLSATRESALELRRSQLAELVRRRVGRIAFWIGGRGATGNLVELERAGARIWPPGRTLAELSAALSALPRSRGPGTEDGGS
jgi:DNA-binding transcriptional MerR regulator